MKGYLNLNGINRIYILGAGFSAPAGFPLTNNLLKEIHHVASKQNFSNEVSEFGQARRLLENLQFYYPLANFSHEMILNDQLPKDFDIEKFVSYVNVESTCQLNTSEQFNEHGSQFVSDLKRWIAQAIFYKQKEALCNVPDFYHKFISLTKNSLIFTFNWDTFLETLLEINNVPYELDSRHNLQPNVLPLFKLHGSIDWFSHPHPVLLKDWMRFQKLGKTFNNLCRGGVEGDSLDNYYQACLTPWIVVPSYDKTDQIKSLGGQWSLLYIFLQSALDVVIIGFSMRDDDYHSRAIIYPQLVQGSQQGYLKVKVISLATSSEDKEIIKNKFAGIKNCSFFFEGFSDKAIQFIAN